ncbi:MAG: formylglycine-generating enzyme family protein [Kiritimatiellae bacterium]|nr:formylglycine-generating enzyme family protein [Kiritimatiellia bacterium]
MKTAKTIGMAITGLAGWLVLGALADGPAVSDVVVRQRWPWSRLVDIDYKLVCSDPATEADVRLVAAYKDADANPLNIPLDSLSGDLYGVKEGFRRIVWDPAKTPYSNESIANFRVTLTATPLPLYMIVDLTAAAGATNQITYVYESDLASGAYGTVVTNPVTNVVSMAWTGVTNNDSYATDKLVLRRVSAGTFMSGGTSTALPTTPAAVSNAFYAGVFEVTQKQWYHVMSNWPSYFSNTAYRDARPVERVNYNAIRGATNDTPFVNWPATGAAVSPDSFLGKLRAKTGISGFDLPTSKQWEYLCRAGTATYYNDGLPMPANTASNDQINALARYINNSAFSSWGPNVTTAAGTAKVGSYLPNAWGLYDTHGNVTEWCLDAVGTGGRVNRSASIGYDGRYLYAGWINNSSAQNDPDWPPYPGTDSTGRGTGLRVVLKLP